MCMISFLVVDGGWSDWGSWSTCSTTCGEGCRSKFRTCTNPEPSGTGSLCTDGGTVDTEIENNCPDNPVCNGTPLIYIF